MALAQSSRRDPLDQHYAVREVLANLKGVSQSLRAAPSDARVALADRLEQIAREVEQWAYAKAGAKVVDDCDEVELVSDTLTMLEHFRRIKRPEARRTLIFFVKAVSEGLDP